MADSKLNAEYIPSFQDTEEVPVNFEDAVEVPEVSTFQGLRSGYDQGVTLGFGDELAGVFGGLGGLAGGDVRDFSDIYQEARDEARQENERIKKGAPIASLFGNMIGGAIPSALMAPAKLAQGLSLGQKALQGAKAAGQAGFAVGGLQGAGMSEAENALGVLQDTGVGAGLGALTGGLVGGGAPLAGAGLSKVSSTAKQIPAGLVDLLRKSQYGDDIAYATEKGLQGEFVMGPQAIARAEQNVIAAEKAAQDQLQKNLNASGLAQKTLLKENPNLKINLDPVYNEALDTLESTLTPTSGAEKAKDALREELFRLRDRAASGDILEAQAQKEGLKNLAKIGMPNDPFPKSPEVSRVAEKTEIDVRKALEKMFEGLDESNPLKKLNKAYESGKLAQEEFLPSAQDIMKSAKPFEPVTKNKLEQFEKLFKESQVKPAIPGVESAPEQIKKAGYEYLKTKNINKPVGEGLGRIVNTALSSAPKIANLAGMAVKSTSDAVKAIASMPSDKVLSLAQSLENSGNKRVAELLKQTLNTQGNAKNAALFMLSQDKNFKEAIFGLEEDSNK